MMLWNPWFSWKILSMSHSISMERSWDLQVLSILKRYKRCELQLCLQFCPTQLHLVLQSSRFPRNTTTTHSASNQFECTKSNREFLIWSVNNSQTNSNYGHLKQNYSHESYWWPILMRVLQTSVKFSSHFHFQNLSIAPESTSMKWSH